MDHLLSGKTRRSRGIIRPRKDDRIRPSRTVATGTIRHHWLLFVSLILLLPPFQPWNNNSPIQRATSGLAEARPPPLPDAPPPPPPPLDRRRTTATTTSAAILPNPNAVSAPAPTTTKEHSSSIHNNNHNSATTQQVLQVVETEVWNGERWIGPNDYTTISRWTLAATGQACDSPAQLQPPEGTTFDGDWKIVTITTSDTNTRDAYGWEYQWGQPYARRQRIWLRGLEPAATLAAAMTTSSTSSSIASTTHTGTGISSTTCTTAIIPPLADLLLQSITRLAVLVTQILRAIRDDWNFKGFGVSLYKSILFKYSCGAAFRIPLTTNWDTWDRHPEWPSASASVALYFPPCIFGGISCSCNVEWVKWITRRTLLALRHVIAWTMLLLARGFLTAGSALAFPVTRQLYLISDDYWNQLLPSLQATSAVAAPRPSFSGTLQERLGVSVSWRVSRKRGYEFRVSYWHLYLPTILSLMEHVDRVQQQVRKSYDRTKAAVVEAASGKKPASAAIAVAKKKQLHDESASDNESEMEDHEENDSKQDFSIMEQTRNLKWADWLQKRTGSLGLSTGYPIPDHPYFSCSTVLSLSALYFQRASPSSAATLLATAAAAKSASSGKKLSNASASTTISSRSSGDSTEGIDGSLVSSSGASHSENEDEDGDNGVLLNDGSTKKRRV